MPPNDPSRNERPIKDKRKLTDAEEARKKQRLMQSKTIATSTTWSTAYRYVFCVSTLLNDPQQRGQRRIEYQYISFLH